MTTKGIDPSTLDDEDLLRELSHLHETRHETFLHGSDEALETHTERTNALEREFVRRTPARQVSADRTRSGAREREG